MNRLSFKSRKFFIQPPASTPFKRISKNLCTYTGVFFNVIASPASTIQYTVLGFESTPVSSESSALTTTRPWLFAD
jgi:hypothetical protein